MIEIDIKCDSHESMLKKREEFHNALIGSPGYINSEIMISDLDLDNLSFSIIIGNNNDNDIIYENVILPKGKKSTKSKNKEEIRND